MIVSSNKSLSKHRKSKPVLGRHVAFAALASMIAVPAVHGATGTWTTDINSGWGTPTNWSGGTIPGGLIDDVANFTANLSAGRTITMDGSRTLGNMVVGDPTTGFFAYTFSANGQGGQLIFEKTAAGNADLTFTTAANNAPNTFNVPLALNDSLTIHTLNTGANLFNGNITGTGGIVITTDGTHPPLPATASNIGRVDLSGYNTFSGGLSLNEGFVVASNPFAVGTGPVTVSNGAGIWFNSSAQVASNITINGLGWNQTTHGQFGALRTDSTTNFLGNITLGSDSRIQGASPGVATISGVIGETNAGTNLEINQLLSGAVASASTWIFNNTNTYTGKTTVNAGTLRIGSGGMTGSLGSTSALEFGNATIEFRRSDNVTVTTPFTQLTGLIGGIAVTGTNFVQSGTGVVTIDNVGSAYTGTTTVNGTNGKLVFGTGGAYAFAGTGLITLANGADLEFNTSSAVSLGNITGAVNSYVIQSGSGTTTLGGAADNAQTWAMVNGGTLLLNKASTSAIHAVGANNNLGLVINGGTAQLGGSGGDQILTEADVRVNGGALDLNGTNEGFDVLSGAGGTVTNNAASSASVLTLGENNSGINTLSPIAYDRTYSGSITDGTGANAGTLGITKAGTGLQVLGGANTYSGLTTINGGTLSVTGSTNASGLVNVNTGGTLSGTGSVGHIFLAAGGSIRPGATNLDTAVGTLTGSSMTVNGGDLRFNLGATSDLIAINSTATFAGTSTITPTFSAPVVTGSNYQLVTATDGVFLTVAPTLAGIPANTRSTFTLTNSANSLDLTVGGDSAKSLIWTGATSAAWDVNTTVNFDGGGAEKFFNLDAVSFGDQAYNRQVTFTGTIVPTTVTVNNSAGNDYVFLGGGFGGSGASLTKTGNGALSLNQANTFGGSVKIMGGTVKAGNAAALGDNIGQTFVSSGATLDVNGQNLGAEVINIIGSGVGGGGALVNTGAQQNNATRFITLTGNATIGGVNRFDIRSNGGGEILDLGGFTLTKIGNNTFGLVGATLVTPGNIQVDQGDFQFETGATVMGGGTLTWAAGTRATFYQSSAALLTRQMVWNGTTVDTIGQNSGVGSNITLGGDVTFVATANTLTLTGNISETGGARSLIKNNAGALTLTGNNTFTGGITSTGGTINLNGTNTVAGPVSITNGVLNVNSTATTTASLGNASSIALSASTLTLNLANSYTLPTTTLSSTNSSTINFIGQTQGTTLSINSALGSTTDFNSLNVQQGTVSLQSGANVTVSVLGVGTTALGTGNVGTLNVLPGASVTTKTFYTGEGTGNSGMVNQSGGTVTVTATDAGNDGALRIGHWNGTGATYTLSGGTLNVANATTSIGVDGSNATLNVSGGTANLYRLLVDGRSATGAIGGTLNLSGGELAIGSGGLGNSGNGQVNISGGKLSASTDSTFSTGMNFGNNAATLDTRGNVVALTGILYGPGGFTKTGNGRLAISGVGSNLAGTINANAGEILLSGSLTSAGTIVNVGAGARLTIDGSGTNAALINGTVNLNGGLLVAGGNGTTSGRVGTLNVTGGEVRPGLAVGTLAAGAMTLTGAKTRFELSGSSTTAGGAVNDLIAVAGALNISTTSVLPSFTSTPVSGNIYTLFTSGSLTGLPTVDPTATPSRLTYNVGMSGTNVTLEVTGTTKSLTWTGANGNVWNVNAAQNWGDPAAETFYQADSVTFDGASAGDISLTGTLQPITTTVNSVADYNFIGNGSIDAGSLVKAGAGTLRLLTANSYIGGTTITGGTLSFGNGALGNGAITMNGGTLQWNGTNTQDVSSRITMVAATIAKFDSNGNTVVLQHPLGNGSTGGLTKVGAGTIVLTSNSTYTGATKVEVGTLQVGIGELGGSVGAGTGAVTVDPGATLSFIRRGTGNAINNPISGGGTLELRGDGSALNGDYVLGGNNSTFNGSVVLDKARLQLDNANDLGGASLLIKNASGILISAGTFSNAITATGNGWLENGSLGAIRFIGTAGNVSGPVTLAGDTRITASAAAEAGTISGVISGPGALSKTGAGTITLSGNSGNTYTGGTVLPNVGGTAFSPLVLAKTSGNAIPGDISIGNGTAGYANLNLGASNQIADTGVITFNGTSGNWAYFKLLGFNETVAGLSSPLIAGAPVFGGVIENMESEVVNVNSVLTADVTGSYAFNGYIRDRAGGTGTGTMGLTKSGSGTQTLIGPNVTYTGTTTVSGGVLKLENTTGFASNIVNDAVVEISAPLGSNYLLGTAKTWSGGGDWIKTGEGRVRLANGIVNATGNIFVQAGILANDNNSANWAGSSANLSVASGATFDIRADSVRLNALNGAGLVTNSYGVGNNTPDVLTVGVSNGNGVFTGRITDGGTGVGELRGGIALTKEGTGSQTFTGTNTYAGTTTISAGTLQVGDGGTTGTLGTNAITNNGTLIFNRSNTHTVNNVISGSGLLVKDGSGTMVLNSSNAYSGATTIAAGTLQLGASATLPVTAGIWLDATDGATVNTAAGAVTGWTNKGTLGSVGNAIAAPGQEPTFVGVEAAMNNQPVIRFDAANAGGGPFDRLTTPIDFSASNVTVIYAGRLTGGANFRLLSGAANNWLLGSHGGLSDRAHLGAASAFVDLGGVTANINPHIYTSTNAIGGTAAFYADTVLRGATTNANLVGPNGLSLGGGFSNAGAAPTTEFSDGDIGELLVFTSILSEEDRRAVEAYLSRKWKGVGSTNVLPTTTAVSLTAAGAALDVNGVTQTIGSIAGVTGTAIALGGGNLTAGGDDSSTTFNGTISGNGTIHKVGAGTWTLGGTNTTDGNIFVDAGTLLLNGSISGSTTTVTGGMLKGDGTLGALTLSSGTVASGTSLGVLNTGDLSLGGGALAFEINGTTAGTSYDQLNVSGSVNLTGLVALTIDLGLFDPADNGSQSFSIISNNLSDGIGFDFANNRAFTYDSIKLGEGDSFFVGNQNFKISYAGGTNNNDVVLTAVPEPGTATSLLGGLALLLGMQRRRRTA